MIDKLRAMAIFSAVVEEGTFRAAAASLGLAPSRVSEIVSELEESLGVTLLYRSTRKISLSHEGRVLHEKVQEMLRAAETGLDAVSPSSSEPSGALRVTLPAFTVQTWLMDAIAAFATAYPKVHLTLDFSDSQRALISDGFDVGIRAGWLKDSDMLTRNLGQVRRCLVASKAYAASQPEPAHASDLEAWNWVRFSVRPDAMLLTSPEGEEVSVMGPQTISVNSAAALYESAVRGLGLTAIPENMAHKGFERGDLVHVLPDWSLVPLGLHAVWPDQSRRENLTMLFVRHLADA